MMLNRDQASQNLDKSLNSENDDSFQLLVSPQDYRKLQKQHKVLINKYNYSQSKLSAKVQENAELSKKLYDLNNKKQTIQKELAACLLQMNAAKYKHKKMLIVAENAEKLKEDIEYKNRIIQQMGAHKVQMEKALESYILEKQAMLNQMEQKKAVYEREMAQQKAQQKAVYEREMTQQKAVYEREMTQQKAVYDREKENFRKLCDKRARNAEEKLMNIEEQNFHLLQKAQKASENMDAMQQQNQQQKKNISCKYGDQIQTLNKEIRQKNEELARLTQQADEQKLTLQNYQERMTAYERSIQQKDTIISAMSTDRDCQRQKISKHLSEVQEQINLLQEISEKLRNSQKQVDLMKQSDKKKQQRILEQAQRIAELEEKVKKDKNKKNATFRKLDKELQKKMKQQQEVLKNLQEYSSSMSKQEQSDEPITQENNPIIQQQIQMSLTLTSQAIHNDA